MKPFFGFPQGFPPTSTAYPLRTTKKRGFFLTRRIGKKTIESLWRLSAQVCEHPQSMIQPAFFARCIEISQVAIPKLTMGMFWLNPEQFLSLDSVMRDYLRKNGVDCDAHDLASYQAVVVSVKKKLGAKFPTFFELSSAAFQEAHRKGLRLPSTEYSRIVPPKTARGELRFWVEENSRQKSTRPAIRR